MFALTWPDFQIIFLSARNGHLKKKLLEELGFRGGFDEKMIRMWLGIEIVMVDLPPLFKSTYKFFQFSHIRKQ